MSDVIVLCFHAVSDDWPDGLAVRRDQLDAAVRRLLERGYVGATFADAVGTPRASRTFAVTFDDAFLSVLRHGLPVLQDLGVPATVFVPTGFADGERPLSWDGIDHWVPGRFAWELAPMDWAGLEHLVDQGWEIGSHTVTHPRLTTLPDAALTAELVLSRAQCEARLGRPCRSIAYPYGDVDARVVRAAADAGYLHGAALPNGPGLPAQELAVPRVGVYRKDSPRRLAVKTSRAGRLLQAVRA